MAHADDAALLSYARNRVAHRQARWNEFVQKVRNDLAAVGLDLFSTITRSGASFSAASAPSMALWSVMATRSIPLRRHAATNCAGVTRQSFE